MQRKLFVTIVLLMTIIVLCGLLFLPYVNFELDSNGGEALSDLLGVELGYSAYDLLKLGTKYGTKDWNSGIYSLYIGIWFQISDIIILSIMCCFLFRGALRESIVYRVLEINSSIALPLVVSFFLMDEELSLGIGAYLFCVALAAVSSIGHRLNKETRQEECASSTSSDNQVSVDVSQKKRKMNDTVPALKKSDHTIPKLTDAEGDSAALNEMQEKTEITGSPSVVLQHIPSGAYFKNVDSIGRIHADRKVDYAMRFSSEIEGLRLLMNAVGYCAENWRAVVLNSDSKNESSIISNN